MMGEFPTRYRLPQAHCVEIGRIITRFAALESRMNKCAWVLMRIDPKRGRVAVRLGRMESALSTIEALIQIAGIHVATDISKLKEPFRKLENFRDALSHAVWAKHAGTKEPVMQVTSGLIPGISRAKAVINPTAGMVTIAVLRKTVKSIDGAVKTIDKLGSEIDAAFRKSGAG